MDISVIIPLFNGEKWIRETLNSVLRQTESPKEIIVVDDGSDDKSPSIVEEFSGVTLIENPGNGPCAARNYGARMSEGEALAFVDQDDLWHKDHLRTVKRAIEDYPNYVGVFSNIAYFDGTGSPEYSLSDHSPRRFDPWKFYPSNSLGEPVGAVVRRSTFEEVDRWTQEFEGCDDYHLWLKLASVGDIVQTGCTTAAHRNHEQSYSHKFRFGAVEEYYSQHVAASGDALKHKRQRGGCTDEYARRHEGGKALLNFLNALRRNDLSGMKASIKQFGAALSSESRTAVASTWDSFVWYISPYIERLDGREFEIKVIELLRQLPEDASYPREILHDWAVGRTPPALLVKRYPFRFYYWRLLARHEIHKLRTRLAP